MVANKTGRKKPVEKKVIFDRMLSTGPSILFPPWFWSKIISGRKYFVGGKIAALLNFEFFCTCSAFRSKLYFRPNSVENINATVTGRRNKYDHIQPTILIRLFLVENIIATVSGRRFKFDQILSQFRFRPNSVEIYKFDQIRSKICA